MSQSIDTIAIKQVDSLIKISFKLTGKGDFKKAFEINAMAGNLASQHPGLNSLAYANYCYNQGRIYYYSKGYKEAENWYVRSDSIFENVLVKNNSEYSRNLYALGILYREMGSYKNSEQSFLSLKSLLKKTAGKTIPDYVECLNALGLLYKDMQKYTSAEKIFLEAKAIQEKMFGDDPYEMANTLNNLAGLYKNMGLYDQAETYYLKVLHIREDCLGKENQLYAIGLMNLGAFYKEKGNYEQAEAYYLEASSLRRRTLGTLHPYYATSIESLAALYKDMGNYEKAVSLYLEVNAIRKKSLGAEHRIYALGLINLANLYTKMKSYDTAKSFYLEAIGIEEKVIGKEHPQYIESLNDLAFIYIYMGKYEEAKTLFLEALTTREKTLGKLNTQYAECLNNLAMLYNEMGKCDLVESIYLQSIDILQKTLGKKHYKYADVLSNLAELYMNLANYKKAEPLLLESKKIRENVLGKKHFLYAESLEQLSNLYETQNRFSESEPVLKELFSLDQERLSKATAFLSEGELAYYSELFNQRSDKLNCYILARSSHSKQSGKLPELDFGNALFYKGFLQTTAIQLNNESSFSPESKKLSLTLKGLRRRLAQEYSKPKSDQSQVSKLERESDDVEKKLRRLVNGYSDATNPVYWKKVRNVLKKDEAAIEFVHFQTRFSNENVRTMYAALLTRYDDKNPKFITLFDERSLDSLILICSESKADYVNQLYTSCNRGATALDAPKKTLYELVWKPLENYLTSVKTIYFSPVGLLFRLDLDAIPISDTMTLGDRYQLVDLNSTRMLVVPKINKNINNNAILFGGIQFDTDSTMQNNITFQTAQVKCDLPNHDTASMGRGGCWNYLPGTAREVNSIENILQSSGISVSQKNGTEATEEAFKQMGTNNSSSPRIIHIATHGFFFPDPRYNSKQSTISSQIEPVFKMSDHPMLRSGLILAGGNSSWQGKPMPEGREDGILTAYEISQMNLSNTELVVLSACETGLGDIEGNEGVYGLQRAFKIAGAKYLIMSLWQVPDKQTSMLMTAFYKKWIEEKLTIPSAFRAAQKELRDLGLDPYQWAGFVLVE